MLRVLGACMVMAGAAGAGGTLCRDRKIRVRQLLSFSKAFRLIAGEISYSRLCLPEVFGEAAEKMAGQDPDGLGEAFGQLSARLQDESGQRFESVWKETMGQYLEKTKLERVEREQVLSFPDAVWYLDGERQQAAVLEFSEEFAAMGQEAFARQREENRITMAFCLACSALAVILLL